MGRIVRRAASLALLLSLASCYNLHARTGHTPEARVREHVEQESKAVFLFWGLYRASDPGAPAWGRERRALSGVHLHSYLSFTDALIGVGTLGVVVPWSVSTEAEVLD